MVYTSFSDANIFNIFSGGSLLPGHTVRLIFFFFAVVLILLCEYAHVTLYILKLNQFSTSKIN